MENGCRVGQNPFICCMAERDHRYAVIRPLYEEGKIKTFMDIFRYVPRTVVAGDLGKKVARFSAQLNHPENFDLTDLFLIGILCQLTRTQMLKLMTMEFAIRDNDISETAVSS
jgi:hypothetical protein